MTNMMSDHRGRARPLPCTHKMSGIPLVADTYKPYPGLVKIARHHIQLYEAALQGKWATNDHMDLMAQREFMDAGVVCPIVHPALRRGLLVLRQNHAKTVIP